MKAKYENLIKAEREQLQDVLPLQMPFSLAVDPCNVCNFRCKFCAIQCSSDPGIIKKQLMEMSLLQKIVDDLKVWGKPLKQLCLTGQGEPFLNPNYIAMIKYVKEANITEWIETVTNGSQFNHLLNKELVNSGINRIRISVEAVDESGYMDMAGVKLDFENYVNNIRDLYEQSRDKCEIYIKTVDAAVNTEEKKNKFFAIFGDICDKIFIDRVIPLWSDFEQISQDFNIKNEGMHGQQLKSIKVCPFPFYKLIINPDGTVTVCCADWKRELVVGDVSKNHFLDIWNGDILKQFWIDMLSGKKDKYKMCQKCVLPMYDCNDDIDEYAEQILERIQQ